jgi:hypothetical protein
LVPQLRELRARLHRTRWEAEQRVLLLLLLLAPLPRQPPPLLTGCDCLEDSPAANAQSLPQQLAADGKLHIFASARRSARNRASCQLGAIADGNVGREK